MKYAKEVNMLLSLIQIRRPYYLVYQTFCEYHVDQIVCIHEERESNG